VGQSNQLAGHVFISYVREDARRVDQLQRAVEAAGIPVWRDTADLWPGDDWRANIKRAITENALVFLACFSRASLSRDKSYQNEELVLAFEQLRLRRPDVPWLIPVRFDECDIPDHDLGAGRTLTSIQRADLFDNHFAEGAERLITAIQRILKRSRGGAAKIKTEPPRNLHKTTKATAEHQHADRLPATRESPTKPRALSRPSGSGIIHSPRPAPAFVEAYSKLSLKKYSPTAAL
jgi:hypothetical protein